MSFQEKNFSEFKDKLASLVVDKISPISTEINKLLKDENFIDKILMKALKKQIKLQQKKLKI